jgi:hypothetical protein
MDPYERTFPFEGAVQFLGLEAGPRVLCHPRIMRKFYLQEVAAYLDRVRRAALGCGVDYCLVDTGAGVDVALTAYLAGRDRFLRGRRAIGGYGA